jgi:hypothetical protein
MARTITAKRSSSSKSSDPTAPQTVRNRDRYKCPECGVALSKCELWKSLPEPETDDPDDPDELSDLQWSEYLASLEDEDGDNSPHTFVDGTCPTHGQICLDLEDHTGKMSTAMTRTTSAKRHPVKKRRKTPTKVV